MCLRHLRVNVWVCHGRMAREGLPDRGLSEPRWACQTARSLKLTERAMQMRRFLTRAEVDDVSKQCAATKCSCWRFWCRKCRSAEWWSAKVQAYGVAWTTT